MLPSPNHDNDACSDLTAVQPSSLAATHAHLLKTSSVSVVCAAGQDEATSQPCISTSSPSNAWKQVSKTVGSSKQAVAKRKANQSVLNGTFVHHPKRWDEYKKKLAELDPNFEVSEDPNLARQVKHSVCGGWFTMAAPYEKERFKKHVTSCSYSTLVAQNEVA
jgi:hypothetical protein